MSPRAGLDRETVIRAAIRLVDKEGLEALTMAGLAGKLGIRTPSLYNHVAGLQDLHRELALRAIRELNARLTRAAVGKAGAEAVLAVANAYRAFIMEHPGLYTATVRSVHMLEPADAELEAASWETLDTVLDVLSSYRFEEREALHAVRGLRSLVHGFASLELAGGFGLPLETDESFRYLVQMLINGFEHRSHTRGEAEEALQA